MQSITINTSTLKVSIVIVVLASFCGAMTSAFVSERGKVHSMISNRLAVQEVEGFIAYHNPGISPELRRGRAELVVEAAYANNLPPTLVASVFAVESTFDCRRVSHAGAIGCMQIMPMWAGIAPGVERVSDLYSPDINIKAGAWILRYMLERCGSEKMFACYEAGERAASDNFTDTGYTDKVERVRWNRQSRLVGGV